MKELVHIRSISSEDSIEELTTLLHRAYKVLGDMGLKFFATHQTAEQTAERVRRGKCFVASDTDGTIVGTITLYFECENSDPAWYLRKDVCYFGQFGVDPTVQGRGIGNRLLKHVEELAKRSGMKEIALDTSEGAAHLIDYYVRQGYRFIQHHSWDVTNYRSQILSKTIS